ncbi:MAG: hypothetical protein AABY06_00610 [Nanoarchaeota archaeon]
MKNLISTLFLAGSLVLSGCRNKEKLEKFNQKNKQVYKDFVEFIEKNGERKYDEKSRENGIVFDYVKDDKIVRIIVNHRLNAIYAYSLSDGNMSIDNNMDGLNSGLFKSDEFFGTKIGLDSIIDIMCAQLYTNAIKEIMRKEKYKNY